MKKTRLEAFSDGVIAIIITIMVLEIHVPDTADWHSFLHILPTIFGYALSFVFVGIYWNNHHHLLHTAEKVNASIMWANLNLLFCLSLVPFGTAWMSKTDFSTFSVVVYAVMLLICGVAYSILARTISNTLANHNPMKQILIKSGFKEIFSIVCYSLAIATAFWQTSVSLGLFVLVAISWLIPNKAIEKELAGLE